MGFLPRITSENSPQIPRKKNFGAPPKNPPYLRLSSRHSYGGTFKHRSEIPLAFLPGFHPENHSGNFSNSKVFFKNSFEKPYKNHQEIPLKFLQRCSKQFIRGLMQIDPRIYRGVPVAIPPGCFLRISSKIFGNSFKKSFRIFQKIPSENLGQISLGIVKKCSKILPKLLLVILSRIPSSKPSINH